MRIVLLALEVVTVPGLRHALIAKGIGATELDGAFNLDGVSTDDYPKAMPAQRAAGPQLTGGQP
ncbi:hypothetical protein [Micromonospora sp. SL4-19]|uniref:hypothetical protein n=1 Tax=Micromonospora sp. SL4-19 TaxID=3399129 RepID=UPI003A4D43A2